MFPKLPWVPFSGPNGKKDWCIIIFFIMYLLGWPWGRSHHCCWGQCVGYFLLYNSWIPICRIVHSTLRTIPPVATNVHVILWSSVVLTWMRDITCVACDTAEFEFILMSPLLMWSTSFGLPRWCGICMHRHSTKWQEKRKKKVTLYVLAHGAVRGYKLISLVVCINDKNLWYNGEKCDIKEWDLNYEHPFPRV